MVILTSLLLLMKPVVVATLQPPPQNISVFREECALATTKICLPKSYDQRVMPFDFINVGVELRVEQISKINDFDSTIELLMYLGISWEENRLNLRSVSPKEPTVDNNIYYISNFDNF